MHLRAPHTPISRLPQTVPEQARRDGHLTAEGSAVAPLSCPQHAYTHVFIKKINLCPAAASRPSAKGAANKESQNYQNKQRGGDTRCPPLVEGRNLPRVGADELPAAALSPGVKMQCSVRGGISLLRQERVTPPCSWGLSWWRGCGVCPLSPSDTRDGPHSQLHLGCYG